MAETVRELIARIDGEIRDQAGWLEIVEAGEGAHLAGGPVRCRADAVEFDDDSGFTTVIPYAAVVALHYGRQGGFDRGETIAIAAATTQWDYREAG